MFLILSILRTMTFIKTTALPLFRKTFLRLLQKHIVARSYDGKTRRNNHAFFNASDFSTSSFASAPSDQSTKEICLTDMPRTKLFLGDTKLFSHLNR